MAKPTPGGGSRLVRRSLLVGLAGLVTGLASTALPHDFDEGDLERHRLDELPFYIYVPRKVGRRAPLVVAIHGISRNAEEHAEAFRRSARGVGAVLLAPVFNSDRYGDYQRLGREGKGARADLDLQRLVAHVRRQLRLKTDQMHLYGHSGGAQFAHRYMLAHPEEVAGLALSSAGWYTWPSERLAYPLGLAGPAGIEGVRFHPEHFLRVPACAFVGEDDVSRDGAFNRSASIDVLQGTTRLERARNWIAVMRRAARARGLETRYELHIVPDADHDLASMVRQGLPRMVFECLFPEEKARAGRS